MKKRVVIGDLHGLQTWKDIVAKENPDITIFLGDYFDSFSLAPIVQFTNFKDLLAEAKQRNFILLLGNHDYHYMFPNTEQYSGYNNETQGLIGYSKNIINDTIDNGMNLVFIDYVNKTIYSHAGVSSKWMETWVEGNNLSLINTTSLKSLVFTYRDGGDWYGSSVYSSPIWIRPEGLLKFPYKDKDGVVWNQVYGHTHRGQPIRDKVDNADFWDMDCLEQGWYMVEKLDEKGKLIDRSIKKFEFSK